MSNSIRFIGTALLCWVAVRAVSLGLVPGTGKLAFDIESARRRPTILPPIEPSILPAIEPMAVEEGGQTAPRGHPVGYAAFSFPGFQPYPIYVPTPVGHPVANSPPQVIYVDPPTPIPRASQEDGATVDAGGITAGTAIAGAVPQFTPPLASRATRQGLDRLSLSSWALMRNEAGPDSLANSGMLGGSEAGARLTWRYDPRLAATLRTSAPVNSQRGMEAAVGVRYQPFLSVPVAFTLERRRAFGLYGRNAFALFAEGGIYGRPAPWQMSLDGYFQAGLVDFNKPDWFVDGQVAVSRPIWRNFSAGLGAWGGAQPGLGRIDVGPRLSAGLGKGMRAHADYRLHVAGNARPGTGPALTLAADF